MLTYHEPAREIEIYGTYDVVVVGGGCAGLAAAIAAARAGAATLIVERFGYFGGTATASLMANINAFRNQRKPDGLQTTRGIGEELIRALHRVGGLGQSSYQQEEYDLETGELAYSYGIDPEKFKYVALRMVVEAGVEVLFHTYFCDAIMEDKELKGVIVESKSGRSAIMGQVIVDASGDADVAFRAGVPFWQVEGSEAPRLGDQLMYRITGFPLSTEHGPVRGSITNGCMTVWGPAPPPGNGVDARELTQAEIVARLAVYEHLAQLKAINPALKDAVLIDTGPLIGIRQTRFIEGHYKLTAKDALAGRRFGDTVALCSSPIIHYYGYRRYLEHEGFGIPYRCLIPQGVQNLLVAGRCISCDQAAYESIRAMAPILAIGQAAGVAAALSAMSGVAPHRLNPRELQAALVAQGAEIGQGSCKK